jgi:nucleoside-diphosphate-sugar epimerase
MKCIITGVAGFVGSHLAERVLMDGHTVLGIDCFTDFYPRSIKKQNIAALTQNANMVFMEGNLLNLPLEVIFKECDTVFHLAAQAGVRTCWGKEFEVYSNNNVLATQRVLEAAKNAGVRRVVYASSSSIYGETQEFPMKESATPRPFSPYGATKLTGEHLCMLYRNNFHISTVILRYFTVYGPRQRPDMAFHLFGKAILRHEQPIVFGNGNQTRDFTYVSDAVEATYAAAFPDDIDGMVFNIGGGSRVSLLNVFPILEKLSDWQIQPVFHSIQKGDVRHTAADTTLAQLYLKFVPQVSLEEGLEREMSWLKTVYK